MKNSLLNTFVVDKKTNTITVKKEFNASQALVWQTWTEAELLDQWWGPKPFYTVTKSMNFTIGGRRLYAMIGPNGEKQWCFADYTSINPKISFSYTDGFCDSEGNENDLHPGSDWNVNFKENEGLTTVTILIQHKSLADLEKIIEFGFKEGITTCLEQLDEMLQN